MGWLRPQTEPHPGSGTPGRPSPLRSAAHPLEGQILLPPACLLAFFFERSSATRMATPVG